MTHSWMNHTAERCCAKVCGKKWPQSFVCPQTALGHKTIDHTSGEEREWAGNHRRELLLFNNQYAINRWAMVSKS